MKDMISSNIIKDISGKLTEYLEIKDSIVENEYFEVFGDAFSVIRLLKNANSLIVKKRFQAFLKGFSKQDNPSDWQLSKLYDYIDNEAKAEYIADLFSKVFFQIQNCHAQ